MVGATSSLARALIPALSRFAEVLTAGRSNCDIQLDLAAPLDAVARLPQIDVLVNAAASFASSDPADIAAIERINALGTLELCQLCSAAAIPHMVQISSIFTTLPANSPFYSAYALSKRHADELAQLYCDKAGIALTIIRPSQFYGAGPAYRKHQPFLYALIDQVANNQDVSIYGSHDAQRNFIHVEDVARLTARAIEHGLTGNYACTQLHAVRYSDIIKAAASAFDSRSQMVFMRDKPDIPDNICAVDDTLFRLLDSYPEIPIEIGMEKEAAYRKSLT